MGRKARTELAGVVDQTSMRHLDDAGKQHINIYVLE